MKLHPFFILSLETLRYIWVSWMILSWIIFCTPVSTPAQTMYQNSVVRITAETEFNGNTTTEYGTGFIFCADAKDNCAYILTANHVIEHDADSISHDRICVRFFGRGRDIEVEVYKVFKDYDVAVLKLCNYPSYISTLDISPSIFPRLNDEVFVVGYPGGRNLVYSRGYLNELASEKICATGISIDRGYSGGPLIHKDQGIVLGMFQVKNLQAKYQCALSISFIKTLIPEICNPCYPEPPCPVLSDEQELLLCQAWRLADNHFCAKSLELFNKFWRTLDEKNCLKLNNSNPPYDPKKKCELSVKTFQEILKGCYDSYCK